jgi:Mg-chelatase subunit ChlD
MIRRYTRLTEEERIPYPYIKGGGVVLPDCSKGVYRPFRLTTGEKRQLIRGLAEKGLQSIDEFLSEPRSKGAVAEKMEEIRKRINEQLEKVRSQRRGSLDDEVKRMVERGGLIHKEAEDALLTDESAFRRFSSEQIRGEILASELIGALEGRERPVDHVEKVGFAKRIWIVIRRFFRWLMGKLLSLMGRIKRFFTRSKKDTGEERHRKGSRKGAISLPFPSLQKDLEKWEEEMDKKLDEDPHLQNAVNKRLSDRYGYDSGRIQLKRSYDPKWYKEEARKLLEEEIRTRAELKKKELESKRSEMSRSQAQRKERVRKLREEIMLKEKEFEKEGEESSRKLEKLTHEEMKLELINTLSSMGYLERSGGRGTLEDASIEWEVTEALVEKFSEFILAEVMEKRSGMKDRRGRQISDAGVYEKARMRTIAEEPRMDMLQTMVNARTNHPGDRSIEPFDIVVHREVTTSELHGVILVDVSGSMEENMRIEAAKRSVLALTQAIKRENPRNKVDIISVSTRARAVTLKEIMSLEPHGFTNHQEGFALARSLFEGSRSDRHLLFLITDGLPEAYLEAGGSPRAGELEKAMEMTLLEVEALRRISDLSFEIFLLEPEDETFISAAKKIAKTGNGNLIVADPQELAYKVIGEYVSSDRVLEGV